jgi:p-aminobenzoyl-glutamate transporter AbgT
LLASLCAVVGLTAIGGGIALVAGPDGRYVHAPTTILSHSPFATFLMPGLLLLFVVGGINVVAALLAIRRDYQTNELALAGGGALLCWIVTEMAMLRTINLFQVTYLVLALAIVVAAVWRVRRERAVRARWPTANAGAA